MIRVREVTARYGDIVALERASLSVERGEHVAIVGPNGSGKSTLLRVLTGVVSPAAGEVQLAGRPLADYGRRELARLVALVPQDTLVELPFTVGEVVLMGRAPHLGRFGFPGERDVERAGEAMARMGVGHLHRRLLQDLSGGERQRVVIARALVQQPDILLLDEPTSHLDIRHQVEIYDLLCELSAETGLTLVSVLHDLNLAAMYCERVALLSEGTVHSIGSAERVLTHEAIRSVYGTEAYVARNEITGKVNVLPLGRAYRP